MSPRSTVSHRVAAVCWAVVLGWAASPAFAQQVAPHPEGKVSVGDFGGVGLLQMRTARFGPRCRPEISTAKGKRLASRHCNRASGYLRHRDFRGRVSCCQQTLPGPGFFPGDWLGIRWVARHGQKSHDDCFAAFSYADTSRGTGRCPKLL